MRFADLSAIAAVTSISTSQGLNIDDNSQVDLGNRDAIGDDCTTATAEQETRSSCEKQDKVCRFLPSKSCEVTRGSASKFMAVWDWTAKLIGCGSSISFRLQLSVFHCIKIKLTIEHGRVGGLGQFLQCVSCSSYACTIDDCRSLRGLPRCEQAIKSCWIGSWRRSCRDVYCTESDSM